MTATATIPVKHLDRLLCCARWCMDENDRVPDDAISRSHRDEGLLCDLLAAGVLDETDDAEFDSNPLQQAIEAGQNAIRAASGEAAFIHDSPEAIIESEGM